MELSCFSSLALTPSAWLTGEEDEEEATVLFQDCNMIKGGIIEGETIGKLTKKNLPAELEDNNEYQRKAIK